MKYLPTWEQLLIQDALDAATSLAIKNIGAVSVYGPGVGSGTSTRSFEFKNSAQQTMHSLELVAEERVETVLKNGVPQRRFAGFGAIVEVCFEYQDSESGESIVLMPSEVTRSGIRDIREERLVEYAPWAEACIMPFVELNYFGDFRQ